MFTALDVSTSGLVAQRARLDAISSNVANVSTTRDEYGNLNPYQSRYVTLAADAELQTGAGGAGVRVASVERSQAPPKFRIDPDHPDADENGRVALPNVDLSTEMVDALQASRAYEANIGVIEITREIGAQTLRIIV